MARLSYREQLLHPNWQRKRLETLDAAKWTCAGCGDKETTLHVHHKRYVKGRMAWEYGADELECLCDPCHKSRHEVRGTLDQILAMDLDGMPMDKFACGLLSGFLSAFKEGDMDVMHGGFRASKRAFGIGLFLGFVGPSELARLVRGYLDSGELEPHPFLDSLISEFEDAP